MTAHHDAVKAFVGPAQGHEEHDEQDDDHEPDADDEEGDGRPAGQRLRHYPAAGRAATASA